MKHLVMQIINDHNNTHTDKATHFIYWYTSNVSFMLREQCDSFYLHSVDLLHSAFCVGSIQILAKDELDKLGCVSDSLEIARK